MLQHSLDTPWKIWNKIWLWLAYPAARFLFWSSGIPWGKGWKLYGLPVIQKHRRSRVEIGPGFSLRSSLRSNPLGPNHPVVLCTWKEGAVLKIGADFAMTGGTICVAQCITIGDRVSVGANSTIIDTDFHPLHPETRRARPEEANTAPVTIEDDVFIGMNSLILKGVTIGRGSVIGAGSVVTRSVPPGSIAAGNPARIVGSVDAK